MSVRKIAKANRGFKGIWIPSDIWLDDNLTIQEMIFLVEIDSLDTNSDGCFASNKHFADFFGLSTRRCSQIINELKNKGYIAIEIVVNEKKQVEKRTIKVLRNFQRGVEENFHRGMEEMFHRGMEEMFHRGMEEMFQGSNTSFSNTNNNIDHSSSKLKNDFDKLWKLYPRKKGKTAAFKHYKKAIKDGATNKQIQDGILSYKKEIETKKIEESYIKHGSTWFSNRGWEDEYDYSVNTKKTISDEIAESQRRIAEAYEQ
ncbi:helix-turn-helix domain-containing protein [Enterococcus hirae]|uniref:helix-turn-helix domain-containing protein n=1 Tax=Enterococcus hirae TaxID=1354 RepID=UPI0032E40F0C